MLTEATRVFASRILDCWCSALRFLSNYRSAGGPVYFGLPRVLQGERL